MDLVQRLGLSDRVLFAGFVPNAEMPPYYSAASATLIPTRRREGTSLSALESMACGTATVVTDVAGLKDVPALKAQPEPEDIARKLHLALDNRQELGQRQMQEVTSVFNLGNWEAAWLNVLNTLTCRAG